MAGPTLDRAGIERNLGYFESAFARGDATAVAAAYAEDARLLEGDRLIEGRQAIGEFWKTLREQRGVSALSLTVQHVEVAIGMAYHLGTCTMRIGGGQDQARTVPFTYVVVWRQSNGTWQIAVDIVSIAAPLSSAT
jgi:uncharacterized protein (TIGR02246 family)